MAKQGRGITHPSYRGPADPLADPRRLAAQQSEVKGGDTLVLAEGFP